MSIIFSLTGRSSILGHSFNRLIYLDENSSFNYEIGITNFNTINLLPNIDNTNNVIMWGEKDEFKIKIPIGPYDLNNLIETIIENIFQKDENSALGIHTEKLRHIPIEELN